MTEGIDQRKYERIFFNKNQQIEGFLSFSSDSKDVFKVSILNLSIGGMHFTQSRKDQRPLKEGDKIFFRTIQGPDPLNFSPGIEIEIKWVLDTDFLEHLGYGGQFINLPEEFTEKIQYVVTNGLQPDNY